ncbi:MAG: phosphate transport system protein [Oceanotoga sp.]|uniref:PhoU-like phosphate uptake regulator n=2 Tax=Petrotogaceae TaxID=1643949 RepID=A0AA45C8Z3_9BACT|nr:phosphate transport system protein [Oceanotoga sp.]PWJ96316.1 PhoU-like phosphate uptake regulator [Oceanotoga teriensis]
MMIDDFEERHLNSFKNDKLIIFLNNVLKMGRLVQGMFYKFKDSYFEKDKNLSNEIIEQDDRLDFLESKLEYDGLTMISANNYTGIYLKASLLGIKLSYIFENMGDLCEENAKINLEILKLPQFVNMVSFEDIFIQSHEMLSISLRLFSDFINLETDKLSKVDIDKKFFEPAKKICAMDIEVNSLLSAYKKHLYKSKESVKTTNLHLNILSNIERFSDFTTNISENIIWALKGVRYKCRGTNLEYFYSLEDDL